jgi:hypothetical protein
VILHTNYTACCENGFTAHGCADPGGAGGGGMPAGRFALLAAAAAVARKLSGWPKICKLAHAFRWEYSYKRLKVAQLLDHFGIFLTCGVP